ncbi:MAG: acyl-CoA dehydrogenase [Acidimicrobiia bacterium]|nr:acyl-CoA dehydrogenase [Acidimicrobiia bacterium]
MDLKAVHNQFRETLVRLYSSRHDEDTTSVSRGVPPFLLRDVLSAGPLRAYIPTEYGGRGGHISDGLGILDTACYHSLSLGLTLGINGALFLQPTSKYGDADAKRRILPRFAGGGALGGLMITEPDFGSDALGMQTSWTEKGDGFHVSGTKHWGGLTGWADYWLITARQRTDSGSLRPGIDLFIAEQDDPDQHIDVEERYNALGLYGIPYGRNRIDITVPGENRLGGGKRGVGMLLDTLHRSRIQFPGMAVGFIRRMVDEAVNHCRQRVVGRTALIEYDQVRARIAELQGRLVTVMAMGHWASENASLDLELSRLSAPANAIKTVATDFMHQAADSLLQLVGATGYRLDHIAGRSLVDSRPFQIFEGSNDILYEQLALSNIKEMRKTGEFNLLRHLADNPLTARAAELLGSHIDRDVPEAPDQRVSVALGRIISRVVGVDMTLALGNTSIPDDWIESAISLLRREISKFTVDLTNDRIVDVIPTSLDNRFWLGADPTGS